MKIIGLFSIILVGCGEAQIVAECTMNGFGHGQCSFSNVGTARGAGCGKGVAYRIQGEPANWDDGMIIYGPILCTGDLTPSSTTQQVFSIPQTSLLCIDHNRDVWTHNCEFQYVWNRHEEGGNKLRIDMFGSESVSY